MALTRRQLLATGAGGTLLLALPGCFARQNASQNGYAFLTVDDVPLARALARAIIGPVVESNESRALAVVGFDTAIAGLPPAVRAEVRQLLDLLNSPLTRGVATGMWRGWVDASNADVEAFLARWRTSGVALFRSGYLALHALISGGWYGGPQAWRAIGYPGPPVLS